MLLCRHVFALIYVNLTDSDEASVGNEELHRMPKDGIVFLIVLLLFLLDVIFC